MNYDPRMRHTVKADTSVTERLHQAQELRYALDIADALRTAGADADLVDTATADLIGNAAAALELPNPTDNVRRWVIDAMRKNEDRSDPFDGL